MYHKQVTKLAKIKQVNCSQMLMVSQWHNEECKNGYGVSANMLGLTALAPYSAQTVPLCCSVKRSGQLVGICPANGELHHTDQSAGQAFHQMKVPNGHT